MADWTDQDPNTLLPGEPWTSGKALAAFENPVAISEGAVNAPIAQAGWHPYNATIAGPDADGVFWDFAVDGAQSLIDSPTFVDGYEYAIVAKNLTHSGGTGIRVRVNYEVSGYQDLYLSDPPLGPYTVWWELSFPRVAARRHRHVLLPVEATIGDPVTANRVSGSGGDRKINSARFQVGFGNINGGTLMLLRRREFVSG